MADKVKMTRPELRQRRDTLARYERYLPTLRLKQQRLQLSVVDQMRKLREAEAQVAEKRAVIDKYACLLERPAGIDIEELVKPAETIEGRQSIAGVEVPHLERLTFAEPSYSLFSTAPWTETAIEDGRELRRSSIERNMALRRLDRLRRELRRVNQRLNLFEKVVIPRTREAIKKIRIYLGDEQTAGVGRAKIAKAKQSKRTLERRVGERELEATS